MTVYSQPNVNVQSLYLMKVYLQASHRDLVGIIEILIEPRPQRVDHVYHFYHPERTYLKKVINIDTQHILFLHNSATEGIGGVSLDGGKIFVCASDPEVTCEIRSIVSVSI